MPKFTVQEKESILSELEKHVSVSETCRKWKISRFTFYAWRKLKHKGNLENKYKRDIDHYRRLKSSIEKNISDLVYENPHFSHFNLYKTAQKKGIGVSYGAIESYLARNNLSTNQKRSEFRSLLPDSFIHISGNQ